MAAAVVPKSAQGELAMTLEKIAIRMVRAIDRATDLIIEISLCIVLLFGVYSLWDSENVYKTADAGNYVAFRPTADDTLSFDELRAKNPEVFAWLTVNDTPIDYPMTQTDNNEKYVNYNAEGDYTLSGAIFLDYRNSPDFDDFNSIVYGHHMEKKMMFGSLSDFDDEAYFNSHLYGNLFFNGRDHGIEFFAFVLTDAYDYELFTPAVVGEEARQAYLDRILSKAIHKRNLPISTDDQILVLSTCTTEITNGRYMLMGKLTDELHLQVKEEKPVVINRGTGIDTKQISKYAQYPVWVWIAAIVFLMLLLIVIRVLTSRNRPESKGR